jgi:hypothetical protein
VVIGTRTLWILTGPRLPWIVVIVVLAGALMPAAAQAAS